MNPTLQRPPPARHAQRRRTPIEAGLPDPRPLTEYAVTVLEEEGNTIVKIELDRPCIIRTPEWAFIDCTDGERVYPPLLGVLDNTTFAFKFDGPMPGSIGLIEVPYQDMQVQNFQGGFVRPGGRWFRKPTA